MSSKHEVRILKCGRSLAMDVHWAGIYVQCNLRNNLQSNIFICNFIDLYKSFFLIFNCYFLRKLYNDKCDLYNGAKWMGNGS